MKISSIIYLFLFCISLQSQNLEPLPESLNLKGYWMMGHNQEYHEKVYVPGIHKDPTIIPNSKLWYKKEITLPKGKWNRITLELKGARFKPEVFINSISQGTQEGGMGPIFFSLKHQNARPGGRIELEVALESLKNVPESDASYIPKADQWRSNVSSSLWDDVVLHFHNDVKITRVIPFINFDKNQAEIKFELNAANKIEGYVKAEIFDKDGAVLLESKGEVNGKLNSLVIDYDHKLKKWSPTQPNLYQLKLSIYDNNKVLNDVSEISLGIKSFQVSEKKFLLNNQPFTARGVTVVWPRWMRTEEGRELGYDTEWFYKNIIKRTKDLGGNYLRYHLGLPPEKFLDLCDEHGLIVQYEWSFFHGMPASEESLLIQYKNWLDLAMRHPSVTLIHPYNETYGDELKTAWSALNKLKKDYPSLVFEERDVIHIHKYWWSLFENLGLYYDSYNDFPKAIMVDEFGGNYLDGNGDYGGYPKVKETFFRFLGREHSIQDRLYFQMDANVKVAEYWRRIGAAGISPFCALGSLEDGNTWFLGDLKEGKPKPVWESLAAVFSPKSISMELWDRNFTSNQRVELSMYLFNETFETSMFNVSIEIENIKGDLIAGKTFKAKVKGNETKVKSINLKMPNNPGEYKVKATLLNPPKELKHPVVSSWNIHVLKAKVPSKIESAKIFVPKYEEELNRFVDEMNLNKVEKITNADVLICGKDTWEKIVNKNTKALPLFEEFINAGKSIVMLDVGDRLLGAGYPNQNGIVIGNLQGQEKLKKKVRNTYDLFAGLKLTFNELVESDSHIHPTKETDELWENLSSKNTWLWNGYRGGLIAPATDMEIIGLKSKAFISQWEEKGAVKEKIIADNYYAFELDGYYSFSNIPMDKIKITELRDKIRFLMEDAPALAASLDPNAKIKIRNLYEEYNKAKSGQAVGFIPLVECGKGLTRTPVAIIQFGENKGQLVVSQLLTSGRLADGFGEEGLYGIRTDEAARQFVLNMISSSIKKN